jgi:restriction system protein
VVLGGGPIGSAPINSFTSRPLSYDKPVALFGGDDAEAAPRIQVATFFERALIERLSGAPDELRTLDRRGFEQLVAELFDGLGYDVELTARTKDGGKDIIALSKREVEIRLLIQCKRPDIGNPVRVHTVRELLGVKVDDGASKAILATTTHFTPEARQFIERHKWSLEGKDFNGINDWISSYLKK